VIARIEALGYSVRLLRNRARFTHSYILDRPARRICKRTNLACVHYRKQKHPTMSPWAPPRRKVAPTHGMTRVSQFSITGLRARRAHHNSPVFSLQADRGHCGAGVPPAKSRWGFVIGSERVRRV